MVRQLILLVIVLLPGCDYPRDADSTLRRVQGGVIRAGVVANPPWAYLDVNQPGGIEPVLLRTLAENMGAKIQWTNGSETTLIERLEDRQLDVIIGGLRTDTPWSDRVGMSQRYLTAIDPITGKKGKHVWAVMPGEGRWLLEVDRFLSTHRDQAEKLLAAAQVAVPDEAPP